MAIYIAYILSIFCDSGVICRVCHQSLSSLSDGDQRSDVFQVALFILMLTVEHFSLNPGRILRTYFWLR